MRVENHLQLVLMTTDTYPETSPNLSERPGPQAADLQVKWTSCPSRSTSPRASGNHLWLILMTSQTPSHLLRSSQELLKTMLSSLLFIRDSQLQDHQVPPMMTFQTSSSESRPSSHLHIDSGALRSS